MLFKTIQLYLIPLLIIFLFFHFYEIKDSEEKQEKNNQTKVINYKVISQKRFLESIDMISKHYEVKIQNIEFKSKKAKLQCEGEFQTTISFLYNLCSKLDCASYRLQYLDHKVYLNIDMYQKALKKISLEKIEFINPYEKSFKNQGVAILDNSIYYNSKWLNVGDIFDNGIIKSIDLKGFTIETDKNKTKYIGLEYGK